MVSALSLLFSIYLSLIAPGHHHAKPADVQGGPPLASVIQPADVQGGPPIN
jgi:hypothetical protein